MSRRSEELFLLEFQWKPQSEIDHKRVVIIYPVEGWIIQLGNSQGPKELISR